MTNTLGVILYGRKTQALEEFIRHSFNPGLMLTIDGALDGMTDTEVVKLVVNEGEDGLPEYLEDGTEVFINTNATVAKIIEARQRHIKLGIKQSLVYCTTDWSDLATRTDVIIPSKILENLVVSLIPPNGKIGLVQPYAELADFEAKHWQALGFPTIRTIFNQESESLETFKTKVSNLAAKNVDIIILDCLAYSEEHLSMVKDIANCPCILPSKVLESVFATLY